MLNFLVFQVAQSSSSLSMDSAWTLDRWRRWSPFRQCRTQGASAATVWMRLAVGQLWWADARCHARVLGNHKSLTNVFLETSCKLRRPNCTSMKPLASVRRKQSSASFLQVNRPSHQFSVVEVDECGRLFTQNLTFKLSYCWVWSCLVRLTDSWVLL